ncbi:DUF6456 domain-containing protein [uncultured Sulfitobacter sp.]|uniref:DUF6456 domain-containing protein n=1 Tax=uncultured Sulfitobacter sp. TaxID=191468 RepID=UPI0026051334|nr:DUF6456 domain-containing protein [uncultured Sulfitobacter sp.]
MGQTAREIEHIEHATQSGDGTVPGWVPRSVQNYLDHTEMGIPIRALARAQGCHASTILRQIRRVETLRDDPLVDGVLKTLGGAEGAMHVPNAQPSKEDTVAPVNTVAPALPDTAALSVNALRVLRRLCETGAVLAVAADMEKGVIVRDGQTGQNTRTGVVDRAIAEAMALKGWIAAPANGRVTRYQITAAGRSALADMMARDENAQVIGAEAVDAENMREIPRRIRYSLAESPLAALARRRDRSGARFLQDDLVHAGERLREDFELAQMEADVAGNWEGFLATLRGEARPPQAGSGFTMRQAHARVIAALQDLGPGLSDVTLRCCCFLEGLETAEKKLGWSARSGKIVLRIALMQLRRHYAKEANLGGAMIG